MEILSNRVVCQSHTGDRWRALGLKGGLWSSAGWEELGRKQLKGASLGNVMSGFHSIVSWWSRNKRRLGPGPGLIHRGGSFAETDPLNRWRQFHLTDHHLHAHLKTLPSPVLCLYYFFFFFEKESQQGRGECWGLPLWNWAPLVSRVARKAGATSPPARWIHSPWGGEGVRSIIITLSHKGCAYSGCGGDDELWWPPQFLLQTMSTGFGPIHSEIDIFFTYPKVPNIKMSRVTTQQKKCS